MNQTSYQIVFAVDAGGSGSRLLTDNGNALISKTALPSLNPASQEDVTAAWAAVLSAAVGTGECRLSTGWIASAGLHSGSLHSTEEVVRKAASAIAFHGALLVTNDVPPLLLARPLEGVGIVAAVGTGTSYIGRDGAGTVATAAGHEYLISDEGSGFDLGMKGLRAAARAHDGRGPHTALLDAAVEEYGLDIPTLGRYLAERPFPKARVGHFAICVCDAAEDGDRVAHDLVRHAVAHVMAGISSICRQIPGAIHNGLRLSGSIATAAGIYRAHLLNEIENGWPGAPVHITTDPAAPVLELARRLERSPETLRPYLELFPHIEVKAQTSKNGGANGG